MPAVYVQCLQHTFIVVITIMAMPIGFDITLDSEILLQLEIMCVINAVGAASKILRERDQALCGLVLLALSRDESWEDCSLLPRNEIVPREEPKRFARGLGFKDWE